MFKNIFLFTIALFFLTALSYGEQDTSKTNDLPKSPSIQISEPSGNNLANEVRTGASHIKLSKADIGKTFDLAKGGTLEIALDGNPTTGYQWSLLSGNDTVLKQIDNYTFKRNPAPKKMVGVGGKFIFNFQAVGLGVAQLKFAFQRSWEKDVPPVETFDVSINVK